MTNELSPAFGRRDATSCPDEERLIAYLTTALPVDEQRYVDNHVDCCDPCVETLLTIQRRLHDMTDQMLPVPESVQRRAEAAIADDGGPTGALQAVRSRWWAGVFLLPILMALSIGAGAFLMVSVQTWRASAPPRILTRAIPIRQSLPVTIPEAVVRAEPDVAATVIAKLMRGDAVEVQSEEHDWYRIALPNGHQGWVEQRAFE